MPRGRQEELRVWLPPELYDRVLREAAVRGVSLSRCVRDRLEAHFGLEEELLDELEERLGATLGRQAESLEQIASDVRLVACLVDRAYLGLRDVLTFRDVRDGDARTAQLSKYHATWRKAAGRLGWDGGLAFHHVDDKQDAGGEKE